MDVHREDKKGPSPAGQTTTFFIFLRKVYLFGIFQKNGMFLWKVLPHHDPGKKFADVHVSVTQ